MAPLYSIRGKSLSSLSSYSYSDNLSRIWGISSARARARSLTGPVIVSDVPAGLHDTEIQWSGWGDAEAWRDVEYYQISAICRLHKDGGPVLFATEVDLYRRADVAAIWID